MTIANAQYLIEERFAGAGISIESVDVREYPDEVIYVVTVPNSYKADAQVVGNELDDELTDAGIKGFVTIRGIEKPLVSANPPSFGVNLASDEVTNFMNLLSERATSSEIRPSLSYIPDTAANISRVTTARHHLVFGRRGAGKTSLLLEAKRIIDSQGHLSVWSNVQTYRKESAMRVILWVFLNICNAMRGALRAGHMESKITELADLQANEIEALLKQISPGELHVTRLVPAIQRLTRRFIDSSGRRIFIFLDDFHYLSRGDQPAVLDMLHGSVRDCDAWLKVASIRHLTRWFQSNPPMGLQTGHDADHIDLDLTLQDPQRAKDFLEQVLRSYANEKGIKAIRRVISSHALDRLVIASGAVPRDYLVLCSDAIAQARLREKARTVGPQDITKAAGIAAKPKITELEEDVSAGGESTGPIIDALIIVRRFCIDDKKCTYFRIDFKDKEKHAGAYSIIQSLLDVRFIHLVNPSVSEEHVAGEKSEVYMLDLSQFSSHRLKKNLKVLDFSGGHMVLSETGTKKEPKIADTSNKLLAILRRGPLFSLGRLVASVKGEP